MKNYDKVTDNLDIATKEIAGKVNVSNASTSQNNSYRLLLNNSSGGSSGEVGVIQDAGLYYNPKTSILYANALKDGGGNVITTTYLTKAVFEAFGLYISSDGYVCQNLSEEV